MKNTVIQKYGAKCGEILKDMVVGGRKARERFRKAGDEIARYGYAPDYNFEYNTLPATAFFRAKVTLTSEAIRVFGPYLYQTNPHRTVSVRPWADDKSKQTAVIMDDYLNYTPGETDLYGHCRKAIDEAIVYGRGVVWTEMHPTKRVVCSTWGSIRDLIIDGDAVIPEDIRYIGRRFTKPRNALLEEIPEAAETINKLPKGSFKQVDDQDITREAGQSSGSDLVSYYKIWTNCSINQFKKGDELMGIMKQQDPEAEETGPRVYYVCEDGTYIHEKDWDVPLYLDGRWPCTWIDFNDHPLSIWPESPLTPGIGYQRAINWLVTLMMGKYRYTSRTALAIVRRNGQGLSDADKDKILVGSDMEAMLLNVNGSEADNVDKFVKQFTWNNDWIQYSVQLLDKYTLMYQKAVGLYEILYTGEGGTQSRTATDAQVKDRNSKSRIDDMRDRIVKWQSQIARTEALTARFLNTSEEITKILGPEAGQAWGFIVKPDQMTVGYWTQTLMAQGASPQDAMMMAQQMVAQALDYDKWRLETDYNIEADSIKRRDIDSQIDALQILQNQLVPTMMQSMIPAERAMAYSITAEYMGKIGSDPKLQSMLTQYAQQLLAMPPPQPAPPEAEPPKGP